jgi:hypothetical protein
MLVCMINKKLTFLLFLAKFYRQARYVSDVHSHYKRGERHVHAQESFFDSPW